MAAVNLQSNGDSRSPERARPWSKIVTGETSELSPPAASVPEHIAKAETDWNVSPVSSVDESGVGCQPEGSDNGGDVVNKPVWKKPVNGVVEAVSPVMDADSWPALGEATKGVRKSGSSESIQTLSDGSLLLPAVKVTGNSSPPSHKPASGSPTSTPNHVTHSGQRSVKRDGGISKDADSLDKKSGKPDAVAVGSVTKDHANKESPRGGFGLQPNGGNDHRRQQNSYRRGNGGPNSRSEGSYGGQGRGNQEWNQHRSFNNRDTNIPSQRGGYRRGGYIRPSVHNSTPFIHPPMPLPVRPFGNGVMYPDVASAMVYFQAPAPPMVPGPQYFPFPDPLHGTIVKQIEYYFSNENLVRDTYLRRNMDEQGWVSVNLIAGFKKVSSLTDNVQLILDVMGQSTVVEVQGDKMRRRNDWMKWLMPPAVQDSLASQLQGIGLNNTSSSGELRSQLQQGGGERAAVA